MKKQPSQRRSRDMVATLLQAAEKEIAKRGLAETTTNHIAARAGVSVGSVYQYFDDKASVVEALLQRNAATLLAAVDARLIALGDADPRAITRAIFEAAFDCVQGSPSQRELVRNWHNLRTHSAFKALEQHLTEATRRYLLRHHREYAIDNLPAALFVAINSSLYTVAHYLSVDDPPLSRDEIITSLSDMLAAYLLKGNLRKEGAATTTKRTPKRARVTRAKAPRAR